MHSPVNFRLKTFPVAIVLAFATMSCHQNNSQQKAVDMNPNNNADAHSFAKPQVAKIQHLDLDLDVNFEKKVLSGTAKYTIEKTPDADQIILDTRDILVKKVTLDADTAPVAFATGIPDEILGTALIIKIKPETKQISITYETSPDAAAVQWLSPAQTAGGKYPFMFTQSQAILARTWIPVQDSPGIRFTYKARIKVPAGMLALMSADNPQQKNETGEYTFVNDLPIPAYLMALSAGDIAFEAFDALTGVYAEPITLKAAAYEFAETGKMLDAAEELYGKYPWGRYDILVLPPSFPFGGMENPKLTFATPTVICGDRSLTSLIAHEMAHSWSGNLVTNSTWNDFWLNEGFTVYFERRIMEKLYGESYSDMLAYLGQQDLKETVEDLIASGKKDDTKLKLNLNGRDPDDGMNDVAYEKGYFFLLLIEKTVGRTKFDTFVNKYFSNFGWKGANTEQFLEFLYQNLFSKNSEESQKIQPEKWIYEAGLPENMPVARSERFEKVKKVCDEFITMGRVNKTQTTNWTSHEWQCFLRNLPENLGTAKMNELDQIFRLTENQNSEIAFVWLSLSIKNNYAEAFGELEKFLLRVGRRKFIKPLYELMNQNPATKQMAMDVYRKARPGYHSVSVKTLDEILSYQP
jgi:leukotriene A-4 hydrolase/aminopeptidase